MTVDKSFENENQNSGTGQDIGHHGSDSLVPGLLLATPHLKDPNFEKSVVLMIEHHDQGALGMIVNRPTQFPVSKVLQSADIHWWGDPDTVLWEGGPVMRESCWLLHENVSLFLDRGMLEVAPGIVLSSSTERLKELARKPPKSMRFLRGVAGWGPSQLEQEMAGGYWITAEVSRDLLFDIPHEEMWQTAYRRMGIDPSFLAHNQGIN